MKEKRKKVYIKGGREENKEMKSLDKAWEQINQVMLSLNKKTLLLNFKNRIKYTMVSLLGF